MSIFDKVIKQGKFHEVKVTGGEPFFGRGEYLCRYFGHDERILGGTGVEGTFLRFVVESFKPNTETQTGDEAQRGQVRCVLIDPRNEYFMRKLKDVLLPLSVSFGNEISDEEGNKYYSLMNDKEGTNKVLTQVREGDLDNTWIRVVGNPKFSKGELVRSKTGEPFADIKFYPISHEEQQALNAEFGDTLAPVEEVEPEPEPPATMPAPPKRGRPMSTPAATTVHTPTPPVATATPTTAPATRRVPAGVRRG